jgi:hypothetical protein
MVVRCRHVVTFDCISRRYPVPRKYVFILPAQTSDLSAHILVSQASTPFNLLLIYHATEDIVPSCLSESSIYFVFVVNVTIEVDSEDLHIPTEWDYKYL